MSLTSKCLNLDHSDKKVYDLMRNSETWKILQSRKTGAFSLRCLVIVCKGNRLDTDLSPVFHSIFNPVLMTPKPVNQMLLGRK